MSQSLFDIELQIFYTPFIKKRLLVNNYEDREDGKMKRHISITLIALLFLSLFCMYPVLSPPIEAQGQDSERQITVLSPRGQPPAIQLKQMAPRLDALDGKTVYLVNDGYLGTDILLGEMQAWFKKNMPGVTTVYKRMAGGGFTAEDPALWAEIKEKADAVIMGMGH
jgi:hypothetical protein